MLRQSETTTPVDLYAFFLYKHIIYHHYRIMTGYTDNWIHISHDSVQDPARILPGVLDPDRVLNFTINVHIQDPKGSCRVLM